MQDEMIVALYWQRDENAISETERKYGRYLTKIAHNILSDWEDSRETVNDTYLKAWNSMPTHKPSILSTYLGKITRQLSIDAFRTRNRDKRKHSEYAVSLSELEDCISGSETTEQSIELKLLAEAINTYVNVPNDLSKIKTKIAFNLTRRQLICFGGAAAVGIPVYLLTRHALGGTGAMFLMIALMLPAFFMAMYERDGLPFEKVARNIIRAKFLRPGVRPYQTQNIYAPFAGKEVTLEQKPQEVKKPDAGR